MKNKLILLLLTFNLYAAYEAINAFSHLSFNDPVGIYHSGDNSNRIFVIEQNGKIKKSYNFEYNKT